MKYVMFGKTGLRVSQLCLGTMTFGAKNWGTNKTDSHKVLNHYFNHGGNFIDTANLYAGGASETIIGSWLNKSKGSRHKAVIGTKYTLSSNPQNPNAGGSGRKNLHHSLHESLKRLKTNYIDILWVHSYDKYTPVEEIMQALHAAVCQGKVLHIAVSNWPAWLVAKANTYAKQLGFTQFSGMQVYYNLVQRTAEGDLFPMANSMGLTSTVWSPLAGGLLTGKYYSKKSGLQIAGSETPKVKITSAMPRLQQKQALIFKNTTGKEEAIVAKLIALAKQLKCPPGVLALAWMMQKKNVGNLVPIIGAKNIGQLSQNLLVSNCAVPKSVLNELNDVSTPQLGYPHNFLKLQAPSIYGEHENTIV